MQNIGGKWVQNLINSNFIRTMGSYFSCLWTLWNISSKFRTWNQTYNWILLGLRLYIPHEVLYKFFIILQTECSISFYDVEYKNIAVSKLSKFVSDNQRIFKEHLRNFPYTFFLFRGKPNIPNINSKICFLLVSLHCIFAIRYHKFLELIKNTFTYNFGIKNTITSRNFLKRIKT